MSSLEIETFALNGELIQLSDSLASSIELLKQVQLLVLDRIGNPSRPRKRSLSGAVSARINERRLRLKFFDAELFFEPAWTMLLDLFAAELARVRVGVSSLTTASGVPATTALAWIRRLSDAGLLERHPDPEDGRRTFVALTPKASKAMRDYFGLLR